MCLLLNLRNDYENIHKNAKIYLHNVKNVI